MSGGIPRLGLGPIDWLGESAPQTHSSDPNNLDQAVQYDTGQVDAFGRPVMGVRRRGAVVGADGTLAGNTEAKRKLLAQRNPDAWASPIPSPLDEAAKSAETNALTQWRRRQGTADNFPVY